jgi:hypothetical protein
MTGSAPFRAVPVFSVTTSETCEGAAVFVVN